MHSTNRSRPSDIYLRVFLHCLQWPSMYIHARLVHMLSVGFHAKDPTAVGVAEIAVQLFIRTQVDACSQLLWQVRCLCFFLLFSTSASPSPFPLPLHFICNFHLIHSSIPPSLSPLLPSFLSPPSFPSFLSLQTLSTTSAQGILPHNNTYQMPRNITLSQPPTVETTHTLPLVVV